MSASASATATATVASEPKLGDIASSPGAGYGGTKTKKNRRPQDKHAKKLMWKAFDENVKSTNIACVYENPETAAASADDEDTCKVCGYKIMLNDINFLTCSNTKCGIMYTDSLNQGAEWRYYGADDSHSRNPTRCGMPVNPILSESSYGCKVLCNGKSSYEMRKIRRYTEWQAMPYREKSQYDEFQHITNMARLSGIPKIIIDEALRYHKIVSEQRTFRGLNRDGIIAASIYISCRINNTPRTAKEIATIFNLDNGAATKGCKNATVIINELESSMDGDQKTKLGTTKPQSFVDRYCSKLNINPELSKLCLFVAMKIDKQNMIPENTPHAIAAGVIYFIAQVCQLNISKLDISKVSNISEVTINKCYKKLANKEVELVPKVIRAKYATAAAPAS